MSSYCFCLFACFFSSSLCSLGDPKNKKNNWTVAFALWLIFTSSSWANCQRWILVSPTKKRFYSNNSTTIFFLCGRGFGGKRGLRGGSRPSSLTSMRRCLWKPSEHLLRALWQHFSPACQLFCSAAWQLSSSLGLTRLRCLQWYSLNFIVGFFYGPLFVPLRHFWVPTMNLFSASVAVTHPSGCIL